MHNFGNLFLSWIVISRVSLAISNWFENVQVILNEYESKYFEHEKWYFELTLKWYVKLTLKWYVELTLMWYVELTLQWYVELTQFYLISFKYLPAFLTQN